MPSRTMLDDHDTRSRRRTASASDYYPQKPRQVARDDSYYDPRDKYYLSGDDESDIGFMPSRRRAASSHVPSREMRRSSHAPSTRDDARRHSVNSYRPVHDDRYHRPSGSSSPPRSAKTSSRSSRGRHSSVRHHASSSNRSKSAKTASSRRPTPTRSASAGSISKKPVLTSAVKVAMEAGAVAAFKARNDPSPWIGAKGTKIVAAALGAAVIDTFMAKKAPKKKGGLSHVALRQATSMAIGNLVLKPAAKGTVMGRGF